MMSSQSASSVVALAGRRIDHAEAVSLRFPLEKIFDVRANILECLQKIKPTSLVSSAACGADLLGLDVAENLNIHSRIVIPFGVHEFMQTYVVHRPCHSLWHCRYSRLTTRASERGDLGELGISPSDKSAYSRSRKAILEEAGSLAQTRFALIVRDGRATGPEDETRQFKDLAEAAQFNVYEIKTL